MNGTSWMGSHGLITSSYMFLSGVSGSVAHSLVDSISSSVSAESFLRFIGFGH